jgi:hypothetical protein
VSGELPGRRPDQIEQAEALLKPQRIETLRQLAEPRSCTEVAVELDQTPSGSTTTSSWPAVS